MMCSLNLYKLAMNGNHLRKKKDSMMSLNLQKSMKMRKKIL